MLKSDNKILRGGKGFTLIEILIVVAIMSMLIAVMIPNLLNSRRRANDVSTMHYLRAVAIKQTDYYIDNSVYASAEGLITGLPTKSNTIIENWQGDNNGYCVQAKHPRGISFKVTADSQVFKGIC